MTTNKKVFTLRLGDTNFQKIKFIADKNKRSIAKQIEYLIEEHILAYEKENGTISTNQ